MNFCQSIFGFFKKGRCLCKERKAGSESNLNCIIETDDHISENNKKNYLTVPEPMNPRADTRLTTELASNDQTILCFEEDFQVLVSAIEKNNSELLATKVQTSDISTFIDSEGFSLLHKAVFANNLQAISILAPKLNPNLTDDSGRTALHYACLQQKGEIIDYLIESGCKLDISDNFNKLPIDYIQDATLLKSFSDVANRKSPNSVFSILETNNTTISNLFSSMEQKRRKTGNYFIKDYEVIRFIGQGSFSKVFLVRNLGNSNFFALKVMNKDQICEKGMLGYVMAEKMILTRLKHPFIIPLMASFQINTHLMLLLHYCPDSLQEKIKSKMPKCVVKLYVCELAMVIGYLHSNCIIYRDLKPSNVLINDDGHIMLADFGLAKEGVRTNSFCGSIGYLAPEMENNQSYGKEVDWYMLGLIIYEMSTGCAYYDNPEKIEELDQTTKNLIERLLDKNVETRLGSSRDFEELKDHAYFHNVTWEKIEKKESNFIFSKKTADFKKSEKILSLSFVEE